MFNSAFSIVVSSRVVIRMPPVVGHMNHFVVMISTVRMVVLVLVPIRIVTPVLDMTIAEWAVSPTTCTTRGLLPG